MLKLALASGVNRYNNYPQDELQGCVPDAEMMQRVFAQMGCNVIILRDSVATDIYILKQLQNFLTKVKAADAYYVGWWHSSHGSHYPRPGEPDGLGEGICCANLSEKDGEWREGFIKDAYLCNLLNSFPTNGIVEVGLDTCYSGGMDRALEISANKPRFIHAPDNIRGQLRLASTGMHEGLNSNIIMWTACSEAETSEDAFIDQGAHGAFTYYWHQSLSPNISRIEQLLSTRAALRGDSYRQTPRLKAWNVAAQRSFGQ